MNSFHSPRHTKVKEPCLPEYLSFAGNKIVGFIPSTSVLEQFEMQTSTSRIRIQFNVSISYNVNYFTHKCHSLFLSLSLSLYIYIYKIKKKNYFKKMFSDTDKQDNIKTQIIIYLVFLKLFKAVSWGGSFGEKRGLWLKTKTQYTSVYESK